MSRAIAKVRLAAHPTKQTKTGHTRTTGTCIVRAQEGGSAFIFVSAIIKQKQ